LVSLLSHFFFDLVVGGFGSWQGWVGLWVVSCIATRFLCVLLTFGIE